MKLNAFRIENFRSIVDTGWHDFSVDNITAMIGQNEAGKTAILEALDAFDANSISADVLRSKDTYPSISCSYILEDNDCQDYVELQSLCQEVQNYIASSNRVNLKVKWNSLTNSTITLEEKKLVELFSDACERNIDDADSEEQRENDNESSEIDELDTALSSKVTHIDAPEFAKIIFDNAPLFSFLENNSSSLPDSISLVDLLDDNSQAPGRKGVLNLFAMAGADKDSIKKIAGYEKRFRDTELNKINKKITKVFRDYWEQTVDQKNKINIKVELGNYPSDNGENSGKQYFEFWVSDGDDGDPLYPKQRSQGVRWFISFFLQVMASKEKEENIVLLVDEPGANLHSKAQRNVLKIFENISEAIQIIYTTHSPDMIDMDKPYRILPVQRENINDEYSATNVYNFHEFSSLSRDTLTPIYSVMGINFSNQLKLREKNNVLVEEISAFYYLDAFKRLFKPELDCCIIAATGVNNLPLLCNQFLGWGMKFLVLTDDDGNGRSVHNELKRNMFGDDDNVAKKCLIKLKGCDGIEDIFKNNDFTELVAPDLKEESKKANSKLVKKQSKGLYALSFLEKVKKGEVTEANFSKESVDAIKKLLCDLSERLT